MDANSLTQMDIARLAEVSQTGVSKWLRGTVPGGAELYKLEKDLGLPPGWFFDGRENELTDTSELRKSVHVKSDIPEMPELIKRVHALVSQKGSKAALAINLGVSQSRLSEWLAMKCTPSGQITLKLLKWVKDQEGKQKRPGSVITTARAQTRNERHI